MPFFAYAKGRFSRDVAHNDATQCLPRPIRLKTFNPRLLSSLVDDLTEVSSLYDFSCVETRDSHITLSLTPSLKKIKVIM